MENDKIGRLMQLEFNLEKCVANRQKGVSPVYHPNFLYLPPTSFATPNYAINHLNIF